MDCATLGEFCDLAWQFSWRIWEGKFWGTTLGMPYEAVLPVIVERADEEGVPYTVIHPYMPTDLGALKRSWIQLKEERDTYREKYHEQERKILKFTRQLENEWTITDYVSMKGKRPWDF